MLLMGISMVKYTNNHTYVNIYLCTGCHKRVLTIFMKLPNSNISQDIAVSSVDMCKKALRNIVSRI